VGKDLCRTILVYTGLKVPEDLELPFEGFGIQKQPGSKSYKEDQFDIKDLISEELKGNKELLEEGNGDSSCGSDDEPSEGKVFEVDWYR
jgi:hypothetical protein